MNATRIVVGLAALTLAIASGWGNYLYVANSGGAIVLAVLAAEMLKFSLPLAIRMHWEQARGVSLFGGVLLWIMVIVFSTLNTFGNAVTRREEAKQQVKNELSQQFRPVAEIAKQIARLPPMDCEQRTQIQFVFDRNPETGKKRKTTKEVKLPIPGICSSRASLQQELDLARKAEERANASTVKVLLSHNPMEDGISMIAAILGYAIPSYVLPFVPVLVWVLFMELGSAIGGLAIPLPRKKGADHGTN